MQFTLGMPFLAVLGKFYRNLKGLNMDVFLTIFFFFFFFFFFYYLFATGGLYSPQKCFVQAAKVHTAKFIVSCPET